MGANEDLLLRLLLTLGLCFLIGLEREIRQKSAGLRTHTLVGLGAAVAMMVSKYGFADLIGNPDVALDPSRVAAQIVSGIGFIGAGLIFVRGDAVHGLTTASVVWVTAMVGMACGAGLYVLAVGATGAHFLVVVGYPVLTKRIPGSRWYPITVRVRYLDGRGILREALATLTQMGFTIAELEVDHRPGDADEVVVELRVRGGGSVTDVVAALDAIAGVQAVATGPLDDTDE